MVIVHVFSPIYWSVRFSGTPFSTKSKKLQRAIDWQKDSNANIVYNLAYFNMKTGETVNYVKGNYVDYGYGGIKERITVSPGNICGGYAVGIKDNETVIGGTSTRTRNGIGMTKLGSVVIAQSTTNISERNFCKEVLTQVSSYYKDSVELFLMEDGGGSTQMYSNYSKLGIAPEGGRKVPTVACVYNKVPISLKSMKTGDKGEHVRYLQMVLGGLVCDGSYGNQTYKRVKEAQKALKLAEIYTGAIDGSCGPLTLKALGLA